MSGEAVVYQWSIWHKEVGQTILGIAHVIDLNLP